MSAVVASKRFSNQVVLVTGGTGNVGSGFVRNFIKQGATVVVPSRSKESLEKLKKAYFADADEKQFFPVVEDISSEKGAENVKSILLEKFGKVDHVVSSMGSWWQGGALTKQTLAEFNKVVHDLAISHFVLAKTFLPLIKDQKNSTYTIITGAAGESPSVESSLTGIAAATLFGISASLRAEFAKSSVHVNEYRIALRIVKEEDVKQAWENSHLVAGKAFTNTIQHVIDKGINGTILSLKPADLKEQLGYYTD